MQNQIEHRLMGRNVDARYTVAGVAHSCAKTINSLKIETGTQSDQLLCHVKKHLPIFGAKGLNLKFN